jgi:hypothetical protein
MQSPHTTAARRTRMRRSSTTQAWHPLRQRSTHSRFPWSRSGREVQLWRRPRLPSEHETTPGPPDNAVSGGGLVVAKSDIEQAHTCMTCHCQSQGTRPQPSSSTRACAARRLQEPPSFNIVTTLQAQESCRTEQSRQTGRCGLEADRSGQGGTYLV